MASKTVTLRLVDFDGESGLVLCLLSQSSGAPSNGSGDALTSGANGLFTSTVTEAITGWFDVLVKDTDGEIVASGGKLHFPSDAVGTYIVDDPNVRYSIAVLPGRDRGTPRSENGEIVVYLEEEHVIARSVVDGNGDPIDMSGLTLQFVIQDARGNDVATIADADITVSGDDSDSYSFDCPAAASEKLGTYSYALNSLSPKWNVAKGDWLVRHRALPDA